MTRHAFGRICILDAFWISELHRAVKLSGACQCAISLMDSAISTLLWGSGFMKTLAIWFVCPFNLIAGMLSGQSVVLTLQGLGVPFPLQLSVKGAAADTGRV